MSELELPPDEDSSQPMVKGLTFLTAKRHLSERFGQEAFDELLLDLPQSTRVLFDDAQINAWYPESHLRVFIHRVHRVLAEGDDDRFMQIARDLALAGISRFFRLIINFASASFVLKKVPVVWIRLRRGPAALQASVQADGTIRISYANFIYCSDPVYRLLSISNCQALVFAACGRVPPVRLVEFGADHMVLEFDPDGDLTPNS